MTEQWDDDGVPIVEGEPERIFFQEDVDRIVERRIAKERRRKEREIEALKAEHAAERKKLIAEVTRLTAGEILGNGDNP